MIEVTHHAVQRYLERIEGWSAVDARLGVTTERDRVRKILSTEAVVAACHARLQMQVKISGPGWRVIIRQGCVITVAFNADGNVKCRYGKAGRSRKIYQRDRRERPPVPRRENWRRELEAAE